MRKRLVAIYSVLVVAIVLLAVFVPSCTPAGQGTIEVKATLCGVPWSGNVSYTLTPETGSPVNGTEVPGSFNVTSGTWICDDVSGGPDGAFLESITPSATQSVSGGDTITFTLNFEEEQDAWIEFVTWTINGVPIEESEDAWYFEGDWYAEVVYCAVIDVHFKQHVVGCQGYEVAVNETSELSINYTWGDKAVRVSVANNACAVVKEPEPIDKVFQLPSFNGEPVQPGEDFELPKYQPVILDVETGWLLEKEIDYTKTINWLGISKLPGAHECVLFDLLVPPSEFMPSYQFTLVASAEVELVDDEDVNPENNYAVSFPLYLTVFVPPI